MHFHEHLRRNTLLLLRRISMLWLRCTNILMACCTWKTLGCSAMSVYVNAKNKDLETQILKMKCLRSTNLEICAVEEHFPQRWRKKLKNVEKKFKQEWKTSSAAIFSIHDGSQMAQKWNWWEFWNKHTKICKRWIFATNVLYLPLNFQATPVTQPKFRSGQP